MSVYTGIDGKLFKQLYQLAVSCVWSKKKDIYVQPHIDNYVKTKNKQINELCKNNVADVFDLEADADSDSESEIESTKNIPKIITQKFYQSKNLLLFYLDLKYEKKNSIQIIGLIGGEMYDYVYIGVQNNKSFIITEGLMYVSVDYILDVRYDMSQYKKINGEILLAKLKEYFIDLCKDSFLF